MAPAQRFRIALTIYGFVILTGFVGYQVFERLTPLDALYMTVITVTTVGFREVEPLDVPGKIFTIFLIVAGVVSATYAALSAAEYFIEGHFRREIERRRMERKIGGLSGHVIVCGFGRVGRHLVRELDRERQDFAVVDNDPRKIEELRQLGHLIIAGDATAEHVLEDAGLRRARALVAAVNSDADNVLITLTAKGLNPHLTVIGRAKADENEAKLRRAGADRVIAPTTIGGHRIAQLLTRPVVTDFLDALGPGGIEYTLEEVPVVGGGPLEGHSLRDAAIRERYGCSVLAVWHPDRHGIDLHPAVEYVLQPGDVLVVLGSEVDVAAMRQHLR